MAIFDHRKKNGIQLGTVRDECMECSYKNRFNEDYVPKSLDYCEVYKVWVNNISHCLCMDCFKESLGRYDLVEHQEDKVEVEEKPKQKRNNKKKEADKDGGETA